jgi:tyrosyl-tRNA synthetase
MDEIRQGIPIVEFLVQKTAVASSRREAREFLKNGAISINKEKVSDDFVVDENCLLRNKYILAQRGRKNYHLIIGS